MNGLSLLAAFGIYAAVKGTDLNYTTLFTSLSLISIMIAPFLTFIQMLPSLYEGFVSWGRISLYVTTRPTIDSDGDITGKGQAQSKRLLHANNRSIIVASLSRVSLGWHDDATLSNVSLSLSKGNITLVVGSAGSGKSTLLKSLIGEVRILSGTLDVNTTRIAFCDQTPFFLPSRTVRENIVLEHDFDRTLYASVLQSCRLGPDIARWPCGDETVIVDAPGSSLSGGQRKRVALARALYHGSELLILDDVFTGIDPRTVREMQSGLFGTNGFLTKRREEMAILIATSTDVSIFPRGFSHDTKRLSGGTLTISDEKITTGGLPSLHRVNLVESINDLEISKGETEETYIDEPLPEKTVELSDKSRSLQGDISASPAKDLGLKGFGTYLKSLGWLNLIVIVLLTMTKAGIDKASCEYLMLLRQIGI